MQRTVKAKSAAMNRILFLDCCNIEEGVSCGSGRVSGVYMVSLIGANG